MQGETYPLFDISGRVAMVTGGGSGLGREFCKVLAEFGADVVCADLYKNLAEETCEIIKKYGHRTLAIEVDVTKYDQVQVMFKQLEGTMGGLDILVNNAGINTPSPVIDRMELRDWHKVLDVNLHGVFYCMKEGLSIMMKRKSGSIINIASVMGQYGVDPDIMPRAHYVASKSAVIGLTKQGAAEYGRHDIRVNCISPGWHLGTGLGGSSRPTGEQLEGFKQLLSSKTPMKRTGEPEELKGLLLYLASDASSFVTGQIIAHDGGWNCWRC